MEDIIRKITDEVYRNLAAMQGTGPAPGENAAPATEIKAGAYELVRMDPGSTVREIGEACDLAASRGYAAVCVPQWFVNLAAEKLKGSRRVDTIVSLPGGTTSTYAKYAEVYEAIKNGADEITIPVNMELVKDGRISDARNDLATAMISATMGEGVCVKALIEADVAPADALRGAAEMICDCGIKHIVLSFVMSGAKANQQCIADIVAAAAGRADVSVLGGEVTGLPQGTARIMASHVT